MKQSAFSRFGGLTSIVVTVTAIVGLIVLFGGSGQPDNDASAAELVKKAHNFSQAQTGAVILIAAMVAFVCYTRWLADRYGRGSALVYAGAGILGLGALVHLVENILVAGLYGSALPAIAAGAPADAATTGISHSAVMASQIAFAILGAGALVIGLGFLLEMAAPKWLGALGVVAGVVEIVSAFVALPPAMGLLLLWTIAIGVRGAAVPSESRHLA